MNLRRISLAAALALAVPVLGSAQSRGNYPSTSSSSTMSAGVLVGMEDFSGDTGLALRADGVFGVKYLAPRVLLSGIVSLGYTNWGTSSGAIDPFTGNGITASSSLNMLKIVPAARFTFDVAPQFDLYADAGLGFYYAHASVKTTTTTAGFPNQVVEASASDTGVLMRFAGGATFALTPSFRLGAEIGFNPYFGDIDQTSFTLMGLAQFRL
jgi:hypothetical protein